MKNNISKKLIILTAMCCFMAITIYAFNCKRYISTQLSDYTWMGTSAGTHLEECAIKDHESDHKDFYYTDDRYKITPSDAECGKSWF